MSLSGYIRTAARRVSWKVFGASAAIALFACCAVALATHSLPPVLAVLVAGLIVLFLGALTLDAITAPFDRGPGSRVGSGLRGSAAAMIGVSAGGGGGGDCGAGSGGSC